MCDRDECIYTETQPPESFPDHNPLVLEDLSVGDMPPILRIENPER